MRTIGIYLSSTKEHWCENSTSPKSLLITHGHKVCEADSTLIRMWNLSFDNLYKCKVSGITSRGSSGKELLIAVCSFHSIRILPVFPCPWTELSIRVEDFQCLFSHPVQCQTDSWGLIRSFNNNIYHVILKAPTNTQIPLVSSILNFLIKTANLLQLYNEVKRLFQKPFGYREFTIPSWPSNVTTGLEIN